MSMTDSSSDRKKDPAWKYSHLSDPKNRNNFTCNFCGKTTKGGVYRLKQHLVGGFRNATSCPKCPPHVREEIRDFMLKKASANEEMNSLPEIDDVDCFGEDEEEDELVEINSKGKRVMSSGGSSKSFSISHRKKMPRYIGPIDTYLTHNAESKMHATKDGKMKQSTINEAYKKEMREKSCRDIARWMYDAGIPFNAVNYPSFKVMVESIGQYGVGMKPPSYHEVRVPLLRKEVETVNDTMKIHKEEWAKYGCSIMADAWTDKTSRTLINFLVNSPRGSIFIKSVDASEYKKTGEMMFTLLDSIVDYVGEENVIQVVTDNASNNVVAGRLLQAKRPHLYWTPCAAHCIDLILEDIGKKPKILRTIKRAIALNSYIYAHTGIVNMLRHFTNKKNLVRPAKTRFATAFLSLERIHKQKNNLRKMFTSEEWTKSNWAKERGGKEATKTVLMVAFWNNIVYTLKVFGPLVRVLRLVDGEKKPAMGYIYEAMDRAKETIAKSFNEKEEKYKEIFKIIDSRWECQLQHHLHAAGYFLNPEYFYANKNIGQDQEVMSGLYKALERFVPSIDEQDKISDELTIYRNAEGVFGMPMATRHRNTKSPAEWWNAYGSSTPTLQRFAIRVLSLTCSSSGCERNWSVFEQIHSKRRNRLAQKRLNDLVFVKYNRALRRRFNARDVIDPITLSDIDESNEWLLGRMDEESEEDDLVYEGDSLTWGAISKATGVDDAPYATRSVRDKDTTPPLESRRKEKELASSSRSISRPRSLNPIRLIDEEEVDPPETEEEEEDIGNDDSDGNDVELDFEPDEDEDI